MSLRVFSVGLASLIAIAASLAPTPASAQVFESQTKRVSSNFLFRVQRREQNNASCAIVYPDGRAHYEMITGTGNTILEGKLDDAFVAQIRALLPVLRTIDPTAIPNRSRTDGVDILILNVPGDRTVNLQFFESSARKPFKDDVDPVLKWLANVHKQHLAALPDKAQNGCMPQSTGNPPATAPEVSPRVAHALAQHLLLTGSIFIHDEGETTDRCFVVRTSGEYHFENRITGWTGEKPKVQAFEGQLDTPELQRLKELLDSPAFRSSSHNPDPENGVAAQHSEIIDLAIPRDDRLQRLRFYSLTGVSVYQRASLVDTDSDEKLLKPLRSWLKDNLEKHKGASEGSTADHCASF